MNARTMFGCGIDQKTFEEKYNSLSEDERQRIERVADRVWLSHLLRYELTINSEVFTFAGGPWGRFSVQDIELPSIEVYLLVTCLDTIAGNPKFQDFDQWLRKQPIESNMNKGEIINLYQQYKEDFGISKNLKSLFLNLPYATTMWLVKNVKIGKITDPRMGHEDNPSQLLKHLFTYFYELRRNEFTHSSQPRQTWMGKDIYDPNEESLWVTPASGTHFILDRKKPNQRWNFSFRQGIDEATILRVIIHSVTLQKMGFDVTERLLQENISHYSRVHALRSFINEVRQNALYLDNLSKQNQKGYDEMASYVYAVGIPPLVKQATEIAITRYKTQNNALETGLQQMTIRYLNEVKAINQLIMNFNEINPPGHNNDSRAEKIRVFLDELSKFPSFNLLTKWPFMVEMTNLWLVIRDPCYT